LSPYLPEPQKIGSRAHAPLPPDSTPKLKEKVIKYVQQTGGSILYHVRTANMTVLMALSLIAIETTATEITLWWCIQLLITL
jgi:hypothetical protein